jgi:hypothetical protein
MKSIIQRSLVEATGISEQEAAQLWEKMPESPFRKLIQYEFEVAQARAREALDIIPPEKISMQQGIVQGFTTALGILARKDPISTKR